MKAPFSASQFASGQSSNNRVRLNPSATDGGMSDMRTAHIVSNSERITELRQMEALLKKEKSYLIQQYAGCMAKRTGIILKGISISAAGTDWKLDLSMSTATANSPADDPNKSRNPTIGVHVDIGKFIDAINPKDKGADLTPVMQALISEMKDISRRLNVIDDLLTLFFRSIPKIDAI